MAAVIGALRIDLSASIAEFAANMQAAGKELEKFGAKFKTIAGDLTKLGASLSIALSAPIIALGVEATRVSIQTGQAVALVDAALKSMGNTSGRSSAQLQQSATALAHISTFSRADIMKNVTAGLLRFGNVQGPVFDKAQKSIVDMAAATGGDLTSATLVLGKALNDPIKGMTALGRAGVQFTQQQKDQIKALVTSGQGIKAQGVILDAVNAKYSGAAKALRDATPGAALKESWEELADTIGKSLVPVLDEVTNAIVKVIDKFEALPPGLQKGIEGVVALVAVVGPLIVIFGSVLEGVAAISEAVGGLTSLFAGAEGAVAGVEGSLAALAAGFAPLIAVVVAAGVFVWSFRDTFVKALGDLWTEAQATIGPAFQALIAAFGNAWTALSTGPVGNALHAILQGLADLLAMILKAFGSTVIQAIANFVKTLADGLNEIADFINLVDDLIHGRWSQAWTDAGNVVADAVSGMIRALGLMFPTINSIADRIEGLRNQTHVGPTQVTSADITAELGPQNRAAPANLPPIKATNFNQGTAPHAHANHIPEATEEATRGLKDLGTSIDDATKQVPEAISKSDAFSKSLEGIVAAAVKAKVNMGQFASTIATIKAAIATFRTTELQREADKFAVAVRGDARAVDEFGNGGLDPLKQKLQDVDDKYTELHDRITDEIDANKILADSNADAAAAMVKLQAQLVSLDAAHARATDAAKAQYEAEQKIAGLQSASANASTTRDIRNFRADSTGVGAAVGSSQSATQKAQDDLDEKRLQLQTQIAQEEDALLKTNDAAEKARISSNIDLQTKYLNLVNSTTAQQLAGQQKINAAWDTFSEGLSSAIQDIGVKGKNVGDDLAKTLGGLLHDAIIKPFADQAAGGITSAIKGVLGLGKSDTKPTGSASDPIYTAMAANALDNLNVAGGGSSGGALASTLQNPTQGIQSAFSSLFSVGGIGGSIGSGISQVTSGIGSFFSKFLGGFAGGGQMHAGGWGIVGENGPELWAPNRTGYVIPATDTGQRGGGTVVMNVTTPDVVGFAANSRQLQRRASQQQRTLGAPA